MKAVFSKFLLFVLICFCSVLGVKGQSYKQVITDFEGTYTSRDYAKRFEIGQKLKNSFQKDLQKEPMRIAEVDNAFGDYYLWTNNYDSSQACYARAVNRVYGLKTDTCFDYAFYLANMAYVLKEMGYYETSDKYYAVALPKLAYYLGSSSEQYSSYLKHYVDLKVDMGDYVNAHAYNEALLFYYKGMKGENDAMYLACLTNKGRILQGQGKYNEAVYIFANLVEATRINFPNDTLSQTTSLNNLAYCYRLLGNNSAAEQYFIEAYRLQTSCKSIPLDHQASLLNNLGIVYKAKCDYINAEKSFIKSIQLYEKAGKAGTAEITNPCNNLGDMYRINGNYEMADHYLKYAIQVREFTSGKESEAYANALINKVLLFLPSINYQGMEPYCKEAGDIYKKILGPNNLNYANILAILANIKARQGKYNDALAYVDSTLNIMEGIGLTNHEFYLSFLKQKADILFNLKIKDDALKCLEKAMKISESTFGNDNYNTIEAQAYYAMYSELAGKKDIARKYYLKSMSKYEKIVKENMSVMGDEEKETFYSKNSWVFVNFESFVVSSILNNMNFKDDSLVQALVNERLWTKSILLNEANSLQRAIANNKDTSIVNLYSKWIEQKKFLQTLYQMSSDERDSFKVDLAYESAVLTSIEKELMQGSKEFNGIKKDYSLNDIKNKLKKNECAVEIIKTYKTMNDTTFKDLYAAIIISPNFKNPRVIVLDSSEFMDSLFVEKYKFNIHSNKTDRLSYNRFYGKIANELKGIDKIYVSPDGVFQKINLYTLFNPNTNKYLIDELEVHQLTSLNDLNREDNAAANQKSVVLFGYPDYELKGGAAPLVTDKVKTEDLIASRFGFSDLPELPGTKVETENIYSVFKENNWDAKLFLAKQATEDQVKQTVGPTILHIATHGFFLPDLDYSDKKIMGFQTELAKANPLLRSGVIMAGAASKDTIIEQKEDGILTAYEASLLNLQNTELVTLSACETGLGDELINGQGVYGLQRAFLTAGAKSVLMSLWVVDDNATKELMTNFYSEWIKNYSSTNKRSSFRKAQLEVKKRYPSPYYWGAFVMIGK